MPAATDNQMLLRALCQRASMLEASSMMLMISCALMYKSTGRLTSAVA